MKAVAAKSCRYEAVVLGASAGGGTVLPEILSWLPSDYTLPLLLVQHLHPSDRDSFAKHLDNSIALAVAVPFDKQPIEPGHLYVAPAGYHMLVEANRTIALSAAEKVNWSMPSIDVLFDSAARVYGERLIAVILSGANSDGAEGMKIVKEFGGLLIAQDPACAEVPIMPRAAIKAAGIETVLPARGIAELLVALCTAQAQTSNDPGGTQPPHHSEYSNE